MEKKDGASLLFFIPPCSIHDHRSQEHFLGALAHGTCETFTAFEDGMQDSCVSPLGLAVLLHYVSDGNEAYLGRTFRNWVKGLLPLPSLPFLFRGPVVVQSQGQGNWTAFPSCGSANSICFLPVPALLGLSRAAGSQLFSGASIPPTGPVAEQSVAQDRACASPCPAWSKGLCLRASLLPTRFHCHCHSFQCPVCLCLGERLLAISVPISPIGFPKLRTNLGEECGAGSIGRQDLGLVLYKNWGEEASTEQTLGQSLP